MSQELAAVGIDAFDEQVYRALLARQAAAPAELAGELGAGAERVARALDRMHDRGLVGRLSGPRRRYAAIDPQHAVEALIQERTVALGRVRSAAGELAGLFEAARRGDAKEVEIVSGREALGRWFVRLQQEARQQVRTLDRPPYALTTANPVEETAMRGGLTYRAVYAPEALEWPGVLDDIRRLVAQGEQARVLPGLRIKLAIADDALALMPLSLDLTDVRAAVIRPSSLLDALTDYWRLCWTVATPLLAPSGSTGPTGTTGSGEESGEPGEEDRLLLALLVSGLKDEAIARQLGWSVRTMRRRMSRLHDQLGAANRFQAGAIAARRGWI
ncbi:helix-turn-helix domain-containing protein [Streptomyces sp. NPDC051563]|uniref:helix-turn-helix domain-containing protein n=1 Tax=unclassified Streptomyces TaxID=2593676 RepID=UPI00378B704C